MERKNDHLEAVASFLLGESTLPSLENLYACRIAAHAYTRSSDHQPELRQAFIAATINHVTIKAELLPLARAWQQAGINFLVFKGFYLAEFVYPSPSQRVYDDVDILIRPEQSAEARRIAQSLGWIESWYRQEAPNPLVHAHEEVHLDKPDKVRLDVHRYIVHGGLFSSDLQKRITEAAWKGAQEQAWEGVSVKVLQPVDTILLGLVLNRAWSDSWQTKPHDMLDFQYTVDNFGLSPRDLELRAKELGCSRSLYLFLQRCNPWERTLKLDSLSPRQRQYWNLLISPERGHLGLERLLKKAYSLPGILVDTVRQLPGVLRVAQDYHREDNLEKFLIGVDKPHQTGHEIPFYRKERLARGIKWAAKLIWPLKRERSLYLSLALFSAFRALDYPATFYRGIYLDEGKPQSYAWTILAGHQPECLNAMHLKAKQVKEVTYRYPPENGREENYVTEGAPRSAEKLSS